MSKKCFYCNGCQRDLWKFKYQESHWSPECQGKLKESRVIQVNFWYVSKITASMECMRSCFYWDPNIFVT